MRDGNTDEVWLIIGRQPSYPRAGCRPLFLPPPPAGAGPHQLTNTTSQDGRGVPAS